MIDTAALMDAQALANKVKADVLPPPPTLTVSEWADRERVLGSEESSEPGRWRTSRIPHLKEIMDAVSDPEVRTVVVKGSARIGKTELENNIIGFHIDQDPSPMLLVYPTEQKVMDYSKEKLDPMLRNTPALRGKVAEAKSRDSKNTLNHKVFQGGFLAMAGANTPNGLDSRTVRLVMFDELNKCARAARQFGDPRSLAKNRTITYPGRWKHIFVSTPSEKGESAITEEYEKGDMCRRYVPCPHCGEFQVLKMGRIKWPAGKPREAIYVCEAEGCGAVITEAERLEMLPRGEWRAENGPHGGTRSFEIWAAYSPWVTFADIAEKFDEANREGIEQLKVFINEWLGEDWDPNKGREGRVEGLLARAREARYASGIVPDEVGLLFGGSDTQDDRIEFLVRGVGVGKKQWTVQHEVIEGNMVLMEPWDRLEQLILQVWPREDGQLMRIKKFCVDAGGHFQAQVLAFCKRPRLQGIVRPVRGATRPQVGLVVPGRKRSPIRYVDTTTIKDTIYASLRIDNPAIPGYQGFPNDLEAGYFQQLLAEKKIDGKYEEVPKGARNEILDCHVYTDAAMALWKIRPGDLEAAVKFYADRRGFPRPADAPEPEEVNTPEQDEPEDPEPVAPPPPPEPVRAPARASPPRVPRLPRRGGGGLMGW